MLGLPYMGSKRKHAKEIVNYILTNNPNAKHFVDLFGGGGAVSLEAAKGGIFGFETVHYNEKNPAIVALLEKIRDDGVTDEFYNWISREDFHRLRTGTDWRAGLVQTVWSFGNHGRYYLYGKDVEIAKKPIHDLLFSPSQETLEKAIRESGLPISDEILTLPDADSRYMFFKRNGYANTEHWWYEVIPRIQRIFEVAQSRLLDSIKITNKCYSDIDILTPPEETIIYCDIPYIGTERYVVGAFDHDSFFDWARDSPFRVYISSYDAPFPSVWEKKTVSTLSSINNALSVTEKLFVNR